MDFSQAAKVRNRETNTTWVLEVMGLNVRSGRGKRIVEANTLRRPGTDGDGVGNGSHQLTALRISREWPPNDWSSGLVGPTTNFVRSVDNFTIFKPSCHHTKKQAFGKARLCCFEHKKGMFLEYTLGPPSPLNLWWMLN